MLIELRGTEFNRRRILFRGLRRFNRRLALIGFRTTGASIFRSRGEKFADLVFTKRTSHMPHVVIWFPLIFDCEVKGGICLVHLQRTTASKFFEKFNRATLLSGCLRSRMESANTVWLVLALKCFGPSLISPHKNLILSFWVFLQSDASPF